MATEVRVPALPESVSDGVIACWHKQPGDTIRRDEALVDIETDKVVLEVPAPEDGVLESILIEDGATVVADQVLAVIRPNGAGQSTAAASAVATPAPGQEGAVAAQASNSVPAQDDAALSPAVRKLVADHDLDPRHIYGSGKGGRITKGDVLVHVEKQAPANAPVVREQPVTREQPGTPDLPLIEEDRPQKRVPMSRLRARIAERLLQATQTTAMLTTFNEVNMEPVRTLRDRHRDAFEKAHGVRLGYMSFFVRAAAEALKRHPDINASIDGDDIVYHGFCDIGVAISTDRGLVVPILRNAEYMSLAEIETEILAFSTRAREGKLAIEDITGGTFTITNGGVFGSMLSTPILNPPQSAILGMHRIQDRPVAVNGEVVVRPVMYLALTYDHRLVDGKSAVTFLKTIVELLEDPAAMLLDI
ncbi:MAG TPA: 2-oxoglutarate dehydrogenase complex dihydrolipoyllysine-residue succinyltransferase [Gammaproteobacteria bacterium]|nr:2-oxoglutarate dehydrogenase complex dihydrolipoyllysine-residue succinyltransferase [Gammaproteobacteria bacterium]